MSASALVLVMSFWTTIFGEPCWPFRKSQADTNPCLDATLKWQDKCRAKGLKVGMVWYTKDQGHWRDRKNNRWHCAGTFIGTDGLAYYDAIEEQAIELSPTEMKDAVYIGLEP